MDDTERLMRGIKGIQDYLEASPPRLGDALFSCEALLAGSEFESRHPDWVREYEKTLQSGAGPAGEQKPQRDRH